MDEIVYQMYDGVKCMYFTLCDATLVCMSIKSICSVKTVKSAPQYSSSLSDIFFAVIGVLIKQIIFLNNDIKEKTVNEYNCDMIETSHEKCKCLETMKFSIEKMNKSQHIEILKILKENDVKINENKSGIYINLSFLSNEAIDKIEKYIKYIDEQEATLSIIERQKDELTMNL